MDFKYHCKSVWCLSRRETSQYLQLWGSCCGAQQWSQPRGASCFRIITSAFWTYKMLRMLRRQSFVIWFFFFFCHKRYMSCVAAALWFQHWDTVLLLQACTRKIIFPVEKIEKCSCILLNVCCANIVVSVGGV